MTRDDIIRLARESGIIQPEIVFKHLERFAALVAAAEREAVLDTIDALMGGERETNNMFSEGYDYALGHIEEFVRARGEAK
jgi:hypothetical protein